jgi:hypothetical protein
MELREKVLATEEADRRGQSGGEGYSGARALGWDGHSFIISWITEMLSKM